MSASKVNRLAENNNAQRSCDLNALDDHRILQCLHRGRHGNKQRFSVGFSEPRCYDVTAGKTVIVRPQYDDCATVLLVEPEVKKHKLIDDIAAVTFPMCDINIWGSKYDEAREMLAAFVRRADVVGLTYNDRLLPEVPFAFSER